MINVTYNNIYCSKFLVNKLGDFNNLKSILIFKDFHEVKST